MPEVCEWNPDLEFIKFIKHEMSKEDEELRDGLVGASELSQEMIRGTKLGRHMYEAISANANEQKRFVEYRAMKALCQACGGTPNFRKQIWSQADGLVYCEGIHHPQPLAP